jgi:predicted DNA-binding protein
MSKKARMTVSLEPEIYERLLAKAKSEGRTAGNLASFLLSRAVEQMEVAKDSSVNT